MKKPLGMDSARKGYGFPARLAYPSGFQYVCERLPIQYFVAFVLFIHILLNQRPNVKSLSPLVDRLRKSYSSIMTGRLRLDDSVYKMQFTDCKIAFYVV